MANVLNAKANSFASFGSPSLHADGNSVASFSGAAIAQGVLNAVGTSRAEFTSNVLLSDVATDEFEYQPLSQTAWTGNIRRQ